MRVFLIALPALALSACVSAQQPGPTDTCRIEAARDYIGRTATVSLGEELLRVTKTRELRWVPPGTMVTMDYRVGRLTVSYDQTMRINRISCG